MNIIKAEPQHLDDIVPLFDAYRVFYRQESNIKKAHKFLKKRITKNESVIYIAYHNDIAVGFTQLYPMFSSVSMRRTFVLNDLYVDQDHRGKGAGKALIDKAKKLCKKLNYKGLTLETESHNPAQHLYERDGFTKSSELHYFWKNDTI